MKKKKMPGFKPGVPLYEIEPGPDSHGGPTDGFPAPWGTSEVPEVRLDLDTVVSLTPAGRDHYARTGQFPPGVQVIGLSVASYSDFTRAADPCASPTERFDAAGRAAVAIMSLIEALRAHMPACRLEIAQLHVRAAEVKMAWHRLARDHREIPGSEKVLASKVPVTAFACACLLRALEGLARLGQQSSPDHALALRLLADVAGDVPDGLREPGRALTLKRAALAALAAARDR